MVGLLLSSAYPYETLRVPSTHPARSPPLLSVGRKRRSFLFLLASKATGLDIAPSSWYICSRGLGTLVRQRETVRLYGPFPTERMAFRQRNRCRVKRSRSIPTLLARHAGQGRGSCVRPARSKVPCHQWLVPLKECG